MERVKTTRKTTLKTTLKTTRKRAEQILILIKNNPAVTKKELASSVGMTEDGVKYHLNKLKINGVLRRVGPDKGGYWEVVDNNI